MKQLTVAALMALALPAFSEEPAPLGPASGLLPLAPLAIADEPAPVEQAAAEQGRLFRAALPENPTEGLRLARFSAPGASAYRLYFEGLALPEGARMFVYGLDETGRVTTVFGPYEGPGPLFEGSFRSRIIPGIEAVVEIQGAAAGPWPVRLPWVASINAGLLSEMRAAADPSLTETPDQRRPARGERTQVEIDGRTVTAEILDGHVLVEGDMIVATVEPAPKGQAPRFAVMRTEASGRWPGGVIPFDGVLKNDPRVTAAIQSWSTALNGVLVFVPRTSEANFVNFASSTASTCHSAVGRQSAATTVVLGPNCTTGNTIHEIGHAIGLKHEQSREDRDNFVQILWDNINTLGLGSNNFDRATGDAYTDIGAYDFASIMHYPFLIGTVPIMQPLVSVPAGITVGQRTAPSLGDINAIKRQYGVLLSRSSISVPAAGGTFSVGVVTQSDRFWVAKDTATFVNLASGLSGQGNGTVQFTVAPNTATTSRTANLNVALAPALLVNATLVINQAGTSCTYSVSPLRIVAGGDPGTYSMTVTTASTCPWSASESLSWASLSATAGTGTRTVSVTLTGNYSSNLNLPIIPPKRTGTITVAGKTVTIEQAGACLLCI